MSGNDNERDDYFRTVVGLGWDALLAEVPGDDPAGVPAAQDDSFRRIRHEREEEDASLPLGRWERELKRANWVAASELSARTLAGRSKDLQLAAWLFEALIARSGFQSLAPCLALIEALFSRYGEQLHPRDGDHRANLMLWINQKLLPPLRKVELTAAGGEREFVWNDWEQAQRNEQLRASLGKQAETEIEGATLNDVGAALACTAYARIALLRRWLGEGLLALEALEHTLAEQLGDDAPGMGMLRGLFEHIDVVLAAEARRRGVVEAAVSTDEEPVDAQAAQPGNEFAHGLPDRREVYAALAEIALALEHIEPHSPVPCLIRRAVAWGSLNTAQLYNEVFVRCGGQLNIFELLGLEEQASAHAAQPSQ